MTKITSFKQYLHEMAFSRNTAEEKITGVGHPIMKHLIKIVKFDDPQNYSKHVHDLNSWLSYANNITIKGNKRLNAKDYFKLIVTDTSFSINSIANIDHQYDVLPRKTDETNLELYNLCVSIMTKVSAKLAVGKFTTITEFL